MAIPRPRKRRGPMSLAQKIALKKAQEASARARRGTGKPDEPKKLRPKAKDYRAKGREMAQRDGVQPGSSARKVRVASRANATGGGGRSGSDRTKFDPRSGNQTVTRFTPKQRAAAVRKAAGVNRPKPQTLSSTTGSGKTANAKRQEELARKAGMTVAEYKKKLANDSRKMTQAAKDQNQGASYKRKPSNLRQTPGGSKPAMGTADPSTMSASAIVKERKELLAKKREGSLSKEEASRLVAIQAESSLRGKNRKEGKGGGPTKISMAKKDSSPARGDNPISDPEGKKREQRRKEMGYDKPAATDLKSMSITELLKMQNNRRTLPAVRKMIDQELNRRADEASGRKRETSDKKASIPKDIKGREINDNTDLVDLPNKDFNKIDDIRMEMNDVALDTLMRDNLVETIDKAETIGEMMNAMEDLYLYLDEWDGMGRNTSEIRRKMDPLFEDLKKYSDRWPRS